MFIAALSLGDLARYPEILGTLPALNALIGASMGHLGNTLNVRLHVEGRAELALYSRQAFIEALGVYVSTLTAFTVIATLGVVGNLALSLMTVSLVFLAVYVLSSLITFYLTLESFRHGWDPDNLVFPVMTTVADFLGYFFTSIALRVLAG
ncbi:MAG: magnesium transporter [Desulfurococcus sp.]|nr:magnesium transporter [Desulfurococcus sp.]